MHGPAGYAWNSDRDGFLTVLGTLSGRVVSFFFWFHCFSLWWVGARRSIHFYFLSFVREATCGLFASSMQHFSCTGFCLFYFSLSEYPRVICAFLFFRSIVRHLREMTSHNIRLQERTLPCMTLSTSIHMANAHSALLAECSDHDWRDAHTRVPARRFVRTGQPRHDVWLRRSSDKQTHFIKVA